MTDDNKIPITGETNPDGQLFAMQIKLPPFWTSSPETWFIQAEAQFNIGRIQKDSSKFYYVIASLPQDVADSIHDILQNPPEINQYDAIKKILIERHSLSIEKRIKKLISDEQLGDRKPSEFYRYLKQLAGSEGTVGDELVRKIWVSRLPHLVNVALIPNETLPIEKILSIADQVFDAMQISSISSVTRTAVPSRSVRLSSPSQVMEPSDAQSNRFDRIETQIAELSRVVASMSHNRSRSHYRNFRRQDSRSRSRGRSPSRSRHCWYHRRFGANATKCVSPCQYNTQAAPVGQAGTSGN